MAGLTVVTELVEFKKPDSLIATPEKYLPPAGIYLVRMDKCTSALATKAVVTFVIQRGEYEGMEFDWEYNFCAKLSHTRDSNWLEFATLCRALHVDFYRLKLNNITDLNGCLPRKILFVEIQALYDMRQIGKYWRYNFAVGEGENEIAENEERNRYERTY